jgi:sporulation-control protein
VTSVTTHYYYKTHLDVAGGFDAHDLDPMDIWPSGLLRNFLEGFEMLGCAHRYEGFDGTYQIIDFQPTTWM